MHRLSDYAYDLPEDRIAQIPAANREASRLLSLDRSTGALRHGHFFEVPRFLKPGDALVINDTRVIPARIEGARATGGRVEIFLLERLAEGGWKALARPTARLKVGEGIALTAGGVARLDAFLNDGIWRVLFEGIEDEESLYSAGRMPLPHYIQRERDGDPRDDLDRERYQTVYSRHDGAVAAPTAGLHFTEALLDRIEKRGVRIVTITLHVGVGTFAPVRDEDYTRHRMHEERYVLTEESAEGLNAVREGGGRIVAVGTTSARVLETLADENGRFRAAEGSTGIFIYPPYRFRALDALITNFHLPRSTLLLLVSAFASRERLLHAYETAVREGYRFFSYGDAMLIGDGVTEPDDDPERLEGQIEKGAGA